MDIELTAGLQGAKLAAWQDFLKRAGLEPDRNIEKTVLIWDDGQLIATASRQDNLLKCIAVDDARQGEGLTATLLTQLRQDAFSQGHSHLFLYTKPKNKFMFSSLFFYPIAQTKDVLLMENRKNGIREFLDTLPQADTQGIAGCIVMNCNPFTKGHRYLIETAAAQCDRLYIFVLSEDKSYFPTADRMEMVRLGTADLPNVTVLPTGPYLISSATFPSYFLKEQNAKEQVHCLLDIAVFCKYYAPKFGITRRYVGTEPLCATTSQYNEALAENLPTQGIELRQVQRLEQDSIPVSASAVRAHLESGNHDALRRLLPQTTYDYLKFRNYLK